VAILEILESIENKFREFDEDKRLFVQKASRSILEIQQTVDNIPDIVILLQVLGYNDDTVRKNGFDTRYQLAYYIHNIIDYYHSDDDNNNISKKQKIVDILFFPIPSIKQRIAEALIYIAPFLGSLMMLYITGVSLWMSRRISPDVTVALVAGVYLGMIFSEGPLQLFSRLFFFYYEQKNIGEVRRILKRNYAVSAIMLGIIISLAYSVAITMKIPYELVNLTILGTITVFLHRISYMLFYTLKKFGYIAVSYVLAFAALLSIYFLIPERIVPDNNIRYTIGLMCSFIILSAFAAYYHYKITNKRSYVNPIEKHPPPPHFYSVPAVSTRSLKSRFGVQFFENIPYLVFGIFYLIMLFADRVLSWVFNPEVISGSNGTILPMAFNSAYHSGADLALFIMVPVSIIQYIIASPLYAFINNRAVTLKVSETKKIDQFVKQLYIKLMVASLLVSLTGAGILYLIGPQILHIARAAEVSVWILNYALIGNVLLSIFTANSLFIMFTRASRILVSLAITGSFIIITGGTMLAGYGFENIILAYVISTGVAAIISTAFAYTRISNNNLLSKFFARYA
jgi:hypothetical protein